MKALTLCEINAVSGGSRIRRNEIIETNNGGSMAFSVASSWVSSVAGGGIGLVVGNGLRGAVIGGAAGFLLGTAIGVGMYLASGD